MSENVGKNREPMLEMFIFETNQLTEQLEEIVLSSEKSGIITEESVNEIFRIMHTIKGSSAMMMFEGISSIAHALEDLFYFLRENKPRNVDYTSIFDIMLAVLDYVRYGVALIEKGETPDPDAGGLVSEIKSLLSVMEGADLGRKKAANRHEPEDDAQKFYISRMKVEKLETPVKYKARVYFEAGCCMENIRAYTLVKNLKDNCSSISHIPEDLIDDTSSAGYISEFGFSIFITTDLAEEQVRKVFDEALFVKAYTVTRVDDFSTDMEQTDAGEFVKPENETMHKEQESSEAQAGIQYNTAIQADALNRNIRQNIINVNVAKLDKLLDLVGEIVITESMVTGNPEVEALANENFTKASRQLRKLTDELQDVVMSIRMIPVSATFGKMHRLVRDLGKKLGKEVELVTTGEDTEVDKNIIDLLADPLMHLVRNAMDHGIEDEEARRDSGKPAAGRILLSAANTGGEVLINIRDDGRGLDRVKILKKAREQGLVQKPENELTEKEIFSFILLPGFSTSDKITELSGRGVGMDIVRKNMEKVGGTISIDSTLGLGTSITVRIPLTLAIIDGMEVAVGDSIYTIPIVSTVESFRPEKESVIADPDGNEMIMIRGRCYPVIRLHNLFKQNTGVMELSEGIITVVENEKYTACLFADRLIGEQQVVVKALPSYILNACKRPGGIGGCTILGDGSISLIIDINSLLNICSRVNI